MRRAALGSNRPPQVQSRAPKGTGLARKMIPPARGRYKELRKHQLVRRNRRAEFFFENRAGRLAAGVGTFVVGQLAEDAWGRTAPLIWEWLRQMF